MRIFSLMSCSLQILSLCPVSREFTTYSIFNTLKSNFSHLNLALIPCNVGGARCMDIPSPIVLGYKSALNPVTTMTIPLVLRNRKSHHTVDCAQAATQ